MTFTIKRGSTPNQHLAYEHTHQVCGVMFHIVHLREMLDATRDTWLQLELNWLQELELSQDAEWEAILEHSRNCRHSMPRRTTVPP